MLTEFPFKMVLSKTWQLPGHHPLTKGCLDFLGKCETWSLV